MRAGNVRGQEITGLDVRGLRPVREWVGGSQRLWRESFDRLDEYVRECKQARCLGPHGGDDQQRRRAQREG